MSGDYERISPYNGYSRKDFHDMSYCYEKYTVKNKPASQPTAMQSGTPSAAQQNQAENSASDATDIESILIEMADKNGMISAEKWNAKFAGTVLANRKGPISVEDAKKLIEEAAKPSKAEIETTLKEMADEKGMISAEKWNEAIEGTGLEKRTEPISIKEATEIIEKFNNGEKVNSDEKETPKKNDRDPKDALLNMFPIINYCTRKRLSFIDPIGYTLEDLGVKYYLNPLKTLFDVYVMKEEPTDGVPMADKILSPVLTTITENLISDKDKAEGIRNILNPGAFLIKKGIEYFC